MSNQQLVRELWEEHEKARFPAGLRGEEVFGVDLAMLDADAVGLVQTFSRTGRLNANQLALAGAIARDLELVLPALKGKGRGYFDRLLRALRAIG